MYLLVKVDEKLKEFAYYAGRAKEGASWTDNKYSAKTYEYAIDACRAAWDLEIEGAHLLEARHVFEEYETLENILNNILL